MKTTPSTQIPMTLFWLYVRIAIMLIVLCSILAAIMIDINLNTIFTFEEIFNILP